MSEVLVSVFVALRITSVSVPLHVTLTFVKDTTLAERTELWKKYRDLVTPHLPVRFKAYGMTKVGDESDEMSALDTLPDNFDLECELDESYEKTVRRGHNKYPKLNYHVTANTEAKKAAVRALGSEFETPVLYMREVGGYKRVLAASSVDPQHTSFTALDRISMYICPASSRHASKSQRKAPKGPRKAPPERETKSMQFASTRRRNRRPPQRFKPNN